MGFESINDAKIQELLALSKRVTNPKARATTKSQHIEYNYNVVDSVSGDISFNIYVRQNTQIEEDFSCGLRWNMPSGEVITLARYNGSSHSHENKIEREKLEFVCHIHLATERYIAIGKKSEGFAKATDAYSTYKGALYCLVKDCNISGLNPEPDQPNLFS